MNDPFPPEFLNRLHPDLHPMLSSFSSSIAAKLIHVEYFLEVHVDHNDTIIGRQGVTTYPITILQPPMQLVTTQVVQVPADWNPTVHAAVEFGLPAND